MIEQGDFVWCKFPMGDKGNNPSSMNHMVYVHAKANHQGRPHLLVIMTTSVEQNPNKAKRPGRIDVDIETARAIGQKKSFGILTTHLAILPEQPEWFPRGEEEKTKAPKRLRSLIHQTVDQITSKYKESIHIVQGAVQKSQKMDSNTRPNGRYRETDLRT